MQVAAQLKSIKMLQIGLYFTCDREGKKGITRETVGKMKAVFINIIEGKEKLVIFMLFNLMLFDGPLPLYNEKNTTLYGYALENITMST